MSMKTTEEMRDIVRAADRDAPGPWAAGANDVIEATEVVDANGRSLFDREGFVAHRSVALHIAASDPQTVVALADREHAHAGALKVLRSAILAARTAHEAFAAHGGVVGGLAPAPVQMAATKALDDLFALIPPSGTPTEEFYYLLRIDDLASPGLSLTWQRDYEPEGDETVADGGQSPTFMLSHSLQCTRSQVDLFDPTKTLAIPCRIVAGVSKDGKVDLCHRYEVMQHGVAPRSPS